MSLFCFYDYLTSNPASLYIRVKPDIAKDTSLVQSIYIFQISLSILFLTRIHVLGVQWWLFYLLLLRSAWETCCILYALMNPLWLVWLLLILGLAKVCVVWRMDVSF